jgi:hypothetical protein
LCLTGAAPGPADAFVYVVNSGIGNPSYPATVSQYDTVDGTLTPLDPPTVTIGGSARKFPQIATV